MAGRRSVGKVLPKVRAICWVRLKLAEYAICARPAFHGLVFFCTGEKSVGVS